MDENALAEKVARAFENNSRGAGDRLRRVINRIG